MPAPRRYAWASLGLRQTNDDPHGDHAFNARLIKKASFGSFSTIRNLFRFDCSSFDSKVQRFYLGEGERATEARFGPPRCLEPGRTTRGATAAPGNVIDGPPPARFLAPRLTSTSWRLVPLVQFLRPRKGAADNTAALHVSLLWAGVVYLVCFVCSFRPAFNVRTQSACS